jgi:hypothetical protein
MPIRIAFLTLLSFLIAATLACSSEGDAAEPPKDESRATPSIAIDKPPAATATLGSQTLQMGVGTYCWSSGSAPGMCVDMAGPVTGPQELVVTAGTEVTVVTQFPAADIESADVAALVPQGQPTRGSNCEMNWSFPPRDRIPLTSNVDASDVRFNATLAPGRYIVTAFLKAPQGDVSYGIVIDVR